MSKEHQSVESGVVPDTILELPGMKKFYRGKVRDVYWIKDKLLLIASDRISAFDHILPRPIPFKGQVLNQIAVHFLEATQDIVPNWLEASPDPNVSIGKVCQPIRIEMVIRGFLAGHAWREYKAGKRHLCGVHLPDGLKENDPFPEPIITPATKAEEGHDEDISKEDILEKGLVSAPDYEKMETYSYQLFQRGSEMARNQGLILVDTKYEFGKHHDQVILIDEIHTPDSSRYFQAAGYEEKQAVGQKQHQLSKEFVREWLMEHDFQGKEGQSMPEMPDAFVWEISNRYIELYERITGKEFVKSPAKNMENRIYENIMKYLSVS